MTPWADLPPQLRGGMDVNDISLVSLWRILLRRRWLVLAVLLLALLAGLYLASRPRVYTAVGTLQVRSGSSDKFRYGNQGAGAQDMDVDDRIESQVSVLESKSLYLKVADELNLATNPAIVGKAASAHPSPSRAVTQARVLGALGRMIKVERLPKTETINISCTTTSPDLSTEIVATLMNQYVVRIFDSQFSSTQRTSKFLSAQLNDLKNQVLDDQRKLVDLQGKLGVVGFDDAHNLVTAQLEDLARANEQANIARITAEARYRILQDEKPELVEGGPPLLGNGAQPASGSLLQTLRGSEAQVRSQYAAASEQFGPNYPETKRLKAELADASGAVTQEQSRVLEQAKISYEAAADNERMTRSALTQEQGTAFQKRNDMVQYQILLHDYDASRTLYEGLMQRLREAGVVSGLESADIDLVDLPTTPVEPSGYGRMTLVAISLALGSVAAFLLAMLIEATDTSVHSVDDLERYIGLPSLAVLPSFQHQVSPRVVQKAESGRSPAASASGTLGAAEVEVLRQPLSPFTEGIRLLRSSVLLARANQPPRTMLFTSAMPQEGKSTVCANLACVLAQSGARVLLVDADLHRPSQHRNFRVSNRKGLSNFLTGTATLEQTLLEVPGVPTLHLIPSGPMAPAPGQLLASEAMRTLLSTTAQDYDFVLIDAAPSLAISDASTLASVMDVVMLVVRDGVANRKMVRRVSQLLLRVGANLPGFVFNGVQKNSVEYYDYKGRGGYYGAGQYATPVDADAV